MRKDIRNEVEHPTLGGMWFSFVGDSMVLHPYPLLGFPSPTLLKISMCFHMVFHEEASVSAYLARKSGLRLISKIDKRIFTYAGWMSTFIRYSYNY